MADVGTEFTDYLRAYALSDFYKLDKASVSDAEINVIFARHKANFDAWRKIPAKYKDVHGRAAPYMIEKAKTDPNFTEADARAAREEHHQESNPYSPIPLVFSQNPEYASLKLTPAHIAAWKCMVDHLMESGYSPKNAEELSAVTTELKCIQELKTKTANNPETSEKEKQDEMREIKEKEKKAKKRHAMLTRKANAEDKPEHEVIRLLSMLNQKATTADAVSPELSMHMATILEKGRLTLLADLLNDRYYGVLNAEVCKVFQNALTEQGIDPEKFEQMRSSMSYFKFGRREVITHKPVSPQNKGENKSAQMIQMQRNMRGRA